MRKLAILFLCGIYSVCSGSDLTKETLRLSPTEQLTFWRSEQFAFSVGKDKRDNFNPGIWFRGYVEDQSEPGTIESICRLEFWVWVTTSSERISDGQVEIDVQVRKKAFELNTTVPLTNSIFHLHPTNGVGSYCVINDPHFAKKNALQPGEYNCFTVGVFNVGRYRFDIRGSSYATDDAEYKAMLSILETLVVSPVVTNAADGALLNAAESGNFEQTVLALASGANIDSVDASGWTPLIYAARNRHSKIALYLIEKGADVHRRTTSEMGSTTLCFATETNDPEVIEELLKRGAKVNDKSKNGLTPLTVAAQDSLIAAAKVLLAHGADVDLPGPLEGKFPRSPLTCAAIRGHSDMMQLFLSSGAKIDLTNSVGDTALMLTAKRDQPAALKLLIKNGACVNAVGKSGHTALIYAAYNGWVENLEILLNAGADPFATAVDSDDPNEKRDKYGPADVALQQGHREAYEIIRKAQRRLRPL